MDICLKPKNLKALLPTDILFQTTYWSQVKSNLGWKPVAFDFQSSTGQTGDVMVVIRSFNNGLAAAYVPQGPEVEPDSEKYGLFLEMLSQEMMKYIDSNVAFIRYDLPWESPYIANLMDGQPWYGYPSPELRELRMNINTNNWNLRKASIDLTVADTLIIDLSQTEDAILTAMKPKTRYNIGLAQRNGVRVFKASAEMLPLFYDLYLQTAKRNGFIPGSYSSLYALFSSLASCPEYSEIIFLLAGKDESIFAGAIIVISGRRALYLFGASSNEKRNMMATYAVHWEGIKIVKDTGCMTYDMGSVSPVADPHHPFYGMYKFKTGFGGKVIHRKGSWDYPFDSQAYLAFRNYESLISLKFKDMRGHSLGKWN